MNKWLGCIHPVYLVGGWPWLTYPLWKMMEFVSWDDDIPNICRNKSKPPARSSSYSHCCWFIPKNYMYIYILYICVHILPQSYVISLQKPSHANSNLPNSPPQSLFLRPFWASQLELPPSFWWSVHRIGETVSQLNTAVASRDYKDRT